MVRVLHCVVKPARAGAETLLMNLFRNIDRTKVQFDFLTSIEGDYEAEMEALGGRVYRIPFITKVGPFAYAKNLRAFFAAHPEYQIVHSHMDKFSGMVMREAAKCGVPVRIAHSHNIKNEGGLAYQLVKDYYGRLVLPYATHLFACADEAARWMFGEKAKDAVIIKNGVDLEQFHLADAADPAHFTIGNAGRLSRQKNQLFLVDIFNEVYKREPSARLEILGEGVLRRQLEDKIRQLGLGDAAHLRGNVPGVEHVMNTFDVYAMPSLFEGLSVALVEAQACGLPCFASDAMPADANVTGDVRFLPLEAGAAAWAEEMVKARGVPKKDNRAVLAENGFDVRQSAAWMQDFYLSVAEGLAAI